MGDVAAVAQGSALAPARGRPRADGVVARACRSLAVRAAAGSHLLVVAAGAVGVLAPRAFAGKFFPPTFSTGLGPVANVILGPAVRWDGTYYLSIAQHGYSTGSASPPVFFPLYPLLVDAAHFLVGSYTTAAVLVSLLALTVALVLLHRLAVLEIGARAADSTVLLVAFAPLAFFFHIAYTESLFLALAVGTFAAARGHRWALACVLGALATLTRNAGILLVVPLVIMMLRAARGPTLRLGWLLALPLALAGYLGYLATQGLSWLAPLSDQAIWHRTTVGPLDGVLRAASAAADGAGAIIAGRQAFYEPTHFGPFSGAGENVALFGILVLAVLLLVGCFRRLPLEYGAYAAVTLIVVLSSPAAGQPLMSFDRFLLPLFPLWMAAGAWAAERRLTRPLVITGGALMCVYMFWFTRWSFVA